MKLNINGSIVELDDEKLKESIDNNSESIEVKSDDIVVRSKEDFETYTSNLKAESQSTGMEIGRKELFKSLEIEIEGTGAHKDLSKSADLLKSWSQSAADKALEEANIEPNKKVEELTKDLETMRTNFQTEQGKVNDLKSEHNNFKTGLERKTLIKSALPENLSIPADDMMLILSNKVKIDKDDSGKFVAFDTDGNVMKNSNLEPLSIKEAVTPFFDENPHYLKKSQGGAGGIDSVGGSSKQSFEDFTKEMVEQGFRPNSPDFVKVMEVRMKEGKLEDI